MPGQRLIQPLSGQRIWLTRPAHQASTWAGALETAGARVDVEPLLEIAPPSDEAGARSALEAAEGADIVVATSSNAVRGAWRLRPQFAPAGILCAVGSATGQALEQAMGREVRTPARDDTSEALLGMPALANVNGREVALLSGEGGRKRLVETLGGRGARVNKVALYRRRPAAIAARRLSALITGNDAVVVTSGEALNHLCALVRACNDSPLYDALARLTVVVPSARVVQLAPEELFARPPRVAARMTVDAIVAALAPGHSGAGQ